MKKFHQLKVFSVILLLSVGLWRCYDEPLEEYSPQTRQGQLTVQEAHSLFMEYASNLTLSRSITPGASRIPLNPGIITPAWEEATLSTTNVNSYVNVPIQTTNAFAVKSPRNDTWVDVIQKLVVVQDDGSHRRNVYLLSIIPEKEFARKSPAEIMRQCDGGNMPDDFSGLIVYTKPQGGIPVYAGSFQDGKLSREIFLFNKTRSFQENLTVLNNILEGYTIRSTTNVPMSRSFSEGGWTGGGSTGGGSTGGGNTGGSGSGGGGDDWQFHTEGDPFTRDGYTCWNSSDGNGNSYIVADTDGDGKPDTIIDNDTDVNPGGGETGGNTGGIGGNTGGTGGNTGESGGDVNPGGGGHGGGSGGGSGGTGIKVINPTNLSQYHGTDDYYLKRLEDFKKRYPNRPAPDYYKNYGDFYLREFKYKTRELLSEQGKMWCDKTLRYLQEEMSKLLSDKPEIELDNESFLDEAFKSHVTAYTEAGITRLSIMDKLYIGTTVYPCDLKSLRGMQQVYKIGIKQIETYQKDWNFAREQAKELQDNSTKILKIIKDYLSNKEKTDPRHQNKSRVSQTNEVSSEEVNEIIRLLFGQSIEYFRETFGDEFTYPI